MLELSILNNKPKQSFIFQLNNENIEFYFEYKDQQLGWFMTLKYNEYSFSNMRIATNPNILRAYASYLPFGLAITTVDGLEPMQIDDFVNGYATLYVLNSDEVNEVEATYYDRTIK